ncbi:hypothetical protein [Fluviispira vulneris]|uniref:hypothetical protein n=1 Tax=Fluviispira vulneris TaxID=2763012 RepID=UPI00164920A8|nr:hypothetical protein [Fluviispira vulneris]
MKFLFYLILFGLFINKNDPYLYADTSEYNIDEKEKISLEIFSEINNLSENYGRFIVVRDHNLFGLHGISNKFLTCQMDLQKWIDNWSTFIKNIHFKNQSNIYPFSTEMQDFFSIQSFQAESIKENCSQVIEKANKSLVIINRSRQYSSEVLSEFSYYLNEISNSKKNLYSILDKYITTSNLILKKLDELNIKSHKSVFSKITIEIYKLNINEPIKILNGFYSLINASRDLNPSVAKIDMTEKKMHDYIDKFKYFSALKLYDHILLDCAKTHREILNSTINSNYLIYNFNKMKRSCSNTYNAFMRFKKKFKSKHDYVLNFIEYTKNNTKIDCSKNINIIRCNEFSIIKSIRIEKIQGFSDKKLALIEYRLNKILEEYKL